MLILPLLQDISDIKNDEAAQTLTTLPSGFKQRSSASQPQLHPQNLDHFFSPQKPQQPQDHRFTNNFPTPTFTRAPQYSDGTDAANARMYQDFGINVITQFDSFSNMFATGYDQHLFLPDGTEGEDGNMTGYWDPGQSEWD